MSYSIERGKRVLTFKTDDQRFNCNVFGENLLFVVACSDNNVYPRTYDWNVVATDHFSEWAKEIQLPVRIWEAACGTDGGSIKPYDRNISGIGYIKTWKQAVKERFPVLTPEGKPLWHPTVSIWAGIDDKQQEAINRQGVELFSPRWKHLRQPLYDAFKRLFPGPLRVSNTTCRVYDAGRFLDAVFLFQNREDLPFKLYLVDREDCRFLRQGAQPELLAA